MSAGLNKAMRRLTADKKKLSILLALAGVGLLLWGRLLMQQRVPRTAMAEPRVTGVESVTDFEECFISVGLEACGVVGEVWGVAEAYQLAQGVNR